MERLRVIGVIPARYDSSRFPGKPLALINGKPMIQHVYERSKEAKSLDDVFIATDDFRIRNTCVSFGATCIMTSKDCRNGTERVYEAIRDIKNVDIVINIQGDEPLITPEVIDAVAKPLIKNPDIQISTAISYIEEEDEYRNPNVVKVVKTKNDFALYFSRSPIPYMKVWQRRKAFKHIGIYGYTVRFLNHIWKLEQTSLEQSESLEQLRFLYYGFPIKVSLVDYSGIGVDTPEDLKLVERIMREEV